jgi:BolA protein
MVAGMHTRDLLLDKLTQALAPVEIDVIDDSAKHRGHAGAAGGGGHFQVRVVAAAFEGKSLVARHRMIYDVLAAEMKGAVHALAIDARTPAEAASAPGRA